MEPLALLLPSLLALSVPAAVLGALNGRASPRRLATRPPFPTKPRPFWVRDLLVQVVLLCQNPNHSPSTPSLTSEVGKAQLASQPHAV